MARNSIHRYDVKEAANIKLGMAGSTVITDGTLNEGLWVEIRCITATKFSVLTDSYMDGTVADIVEFPAGFVLSGLFTAIQLISGSVYALKG